MRHISTGILTRIAHRYPLQSTRVQMCRITRIPMTRFKVSYMLQNFSQCTLELNMDASSYSTAKSSQNLVSPNQIWIVIYTFPDWFGVHNKRNSVWCTNTSLKIVNHNPKIGLDSNKRFRENFSAYEEFFSLSKILTKMPQNYKRVCISTYTLEESSSESC